RSSSADHSFEQDGEIVAGGQAKVRVFGEELKRNPVQRRRQGRVERRRKRRGLIQNPVEQLRLVEGVAERRLAGERFVEQDTERLARDTSRFSLLMSRWTMPCRCTSASARPSWAKTLSSMSSAGRCVRCHSSSGVPRTKSITM